VIRIDASSNLYFTAPLEPVEADGAGADVDPAAPEDAPLDAATDARVEVTTEEVAGKEVESVPTSTVK